MLLSHNVIQDAARRLDLAVTAVMRDFRDGLVRQEPQLTDRLAQAMAQALEGHKRNGLVWRARTFTDRGPGAEEHVVGADLMGILSVSVPHFDVTKRFLAQAKILAKGSALNGSQLADLKRQCEDMLARSSASFVFLYSVDGVVVVPALAVASVRHGRLYDLHQRGLLRFMEEHFACFVGERMQSGDESFIKASMAAVAARLGLVIELEASSPLRDERQRK